MKAKLLAHRPGGHRSDERVLLADLPTPDEILAASRSAKGNRAHARAAAACAAIARQIGLHPLASQIEGEGQAASRGEFTP